METSNDDWQALHEDEEPAVGAAGDHAPPVQREVLEHAILPRGEGDRLAVARDRAGHGVNPHIIDHERGPGLSGTAANERSEARQYSGRAVEESWRCPFHRTNVAASEKR